MIQKSKMHEKIEQESIRLENELQDGLESLHMKTTIMQRLKDELVSQRIRVDIIREERRKLQTKEEYDKEVEKMGRLVNETREYTKPAQEV